MWSPTNTSGSPVKYCTKPISPCASSTTTRTPAARRRAAGAPTARTANQRATESPISSSTASAWTWAMVSGSRPVRWASASPAWGPLPVTTTPSATTTRLVTVRTQVNDRIDGGTAGRRAPWPSTVRRQNA